MSWARPGRRALIGIAAGVAAFGATAALAVTQSSNVSHTIDTDHHPVGAGGPLGPEGVPIPRASELARPQVIVPGERIDAIPCQPGEQVLFHIHAHLTIFVMGVAKQIPAGIGATLPYEVALTPDGPFIERARCFMWLHTHAADGIIHTESPIERTYTLGDFFDIWGQRLDGNHLGTVRGPVTAFFNGRLYNGNPRAIPLSPHAQIQLDVGRPLVAPERIAFPPGL